MEVADAARVADDGTLPGFSLSRPLSAVDPCWYRGAASDGSAVLVRRLDGIPFAAALRDLALAVETLGSAPAGVAPALAVVVTSGGKIIAGAAAASAGFRIAPDAAAAAAVPVDARVDVWAVYADAGEELLAAAAQQPAAAVERLAAVAETLDGLAAPHGAIDAGALRSTPAGPLVLATGLAMLEAARRERLDAVGPWLTVAPERCLPPGLPTQSGDQYALAVLWLAARTGRSPHRAVAADALVKSKLTDPPTIDGIGEPERSVVARALAATAEERYESCTAFAAALAAAVPAGTRVAESSPGPAAPADLTAPPSPVAEVASQPLSVAEVAAASPPVAEVAEPSLAVTTAVSSPMLPDEVIPTRMIPSDQAGFAPPDVSVGRLATAPYKAGDQILPGYRLVRLLGKGGFGEVWRATTPGGMSVAIKAIGNLRSQVGAREFRALSTIKDLKHVHIVPIVGVWLKTADGRLLSESEAESAGRKILGQARGHQGGRASSGSIDTLEIIVVMGLGDGSLHDFLKHRDGEDRGPEAALGVEPRQLLEWMRQAAGAIDYFNRGRVREGLTSEAVQHCDIKPQNILLVGNAVQVCDFGLARVQGEARLTDNNLLSIAYAAPEMMVRPFNPSPTTDQYCLAVTYYELRTGRLPYGDQGDAGAEDLSVVELMKAKTEGQVNPSLVPAAEQRVLQRALSLDPAKRFGSCEEFIDTLEAAVDAEDASAPAPPPPFPWMKAASLAVGAVAVAGMVVYLFLPPPSDKPAQPVVDDSLQVRTMFAEALDRSGAVDLEKIARAAEFARKAAAGGNEACRRLGEAADAVARTAPLIAAEEPDPDSLDRAKTAIDDMPDEVPVAVRDALRRTLGERLAKVRRERVATIFATLDAAVGDDGRSDAGRLSQAETEAGSLASLDEAEAKRIGAVVAAMREIAGVIGDGGREPAGLDAAVGRYDRAADDLPQRAADLLGRGLARRLVDRAVRRLQDDELLDPGAPTAGKARAIDDSYKDLSEALRIDPLSWAAFNEQGFCESLRGRHEQAIELYGKAIVLLEKAGNDPSSREAVLRRRAYSLVKAGRYAAASGDYLDCMKGEATLGKTLLQLANDGLSAGAFAESAAVLDRTRMLLEKNPDVFGGDPPPLAEVLESLVWLMVCGFGEGADEKALPLAKKQLALADDAVAAAAGNDERMANAIVARGNALDNLALALARAGGWDDALRTIDEAIVQVETVPRMQAEFRKHRDAIAAHKPWTEP